MRNLLNYILLLGSLALNIYVYINLSSLFSLFTQFFLPSFFTNSTQKFPFIPFKYIILSSPTTVLLHQAATAITTSNKGLPINIILMNIA
uniref:Uncharacterized protein n=1 Tax=Pyxicephalus adspersus TaxID=30357 RepID=A0AAV3A1G3_PYXAD|nr:TPA: hypothetical protein GDO54_016453 [Pyxicephalus adspersus]